MPLSERSIGNLAFSKKAPEALIQLRAFQDLANVMHTMCDAAQYSFRAMGILHPILLSVRFPYSQHPSPELNKD